MIRVHELAKELKISTMALKTHLTALGVVIKSHMSFIDDEIADKIRQKYTEQINAEKKAEKERKLFKEMRHQADLKAKQEADAAAQAQMQPPKTEAETATPKSETAPEQPLPEKEAKSEAQPEPALPKEELPKREIRVPFQQHKPASKQQPEHEKPRGRTGERQTGKPRTEAPRQAEERTAARGTKRETKPSAHALPETKKRPEFQPRKTGAQAPSAPRKQVPPPSPLAPAKETEVKKFGKSKISHEELGEKSKHRKAQIEKQKKERAVIAEPSELEEAEIARSITRTLAKSQKKKKYHREAQTVADNEQGEIVIREFTSVSELAKIIDVPPSEIITKFFKMGQLVTINQRLDRDSLEMICDEFNLNFRFEDEYGKELLKKETEQYTQAERFTRPPVVTIMGHVDHGKTSILDYIRNTNVVAGESGGITQHIGAYQIEINKHKITFLDTPGHEAFTAMRSRGANVTDIAVIVVSATEGVKPQTVEAIDHARAAGVPLIVAINKVDLPEANIDRTISQLLDLGVYLENYGGDVPWCKTSAVTGEGILNLIELILLTAEMKELTAPLDVPAEAVVIEAEKDPRMGAVVTILVKEGQLRKGDIVVCGATYGRIRRMENERGAEIKLLQPSDVARIYGLNDVPKAGDILNHAENEKTARQISSERQQMRMEREKYQTKTSLQNIFTRIQENKMTELKIILKADTDGSVEALADSFQKLSNQEVMVDIIHKSVGGISEADVSLAAASDAIIIGFRVRASQQAKKLAEEEHVEIKTYQVIYDAIDDVKRALEGLLAPEFEEKPLGTVTIKQIFKIKKLGSIAGCFVEKGVVQRNCNVRLFRDDKLIYEGKLASLKHFQNEVSEVRAGSECGLTLENFQDIQEGDVIECYTLQQVEKKLL